jgi:hypothetical protein
VRSPDGNCPKDSPDFSRRGGDFFIENVMEELDYPGEFFFDKRTEKLTSSITVSRFKTAPMLLESRVSGSMSSMFSRILDLWRVLRDLE